MQTTPTARDALYLNVFTAAIEGGINYWAAVSAYHWTNDPEGDALNAQDHAGFFAVISDQEDDEEPEHLVNRSVIARGMRLIAEGETQLNETLRAEIARAYRKPENDDDYDIDAEQADCILQVGLFNEIVYG